MTNVHLYMLIDCYFTLTLAAYVLCYNEVLNVCYSQYNKYKYRSQRVYNIVYLLCMYNYRNHSKL
jgi:hypothetical protein